MEEARASLERGRDQLESSRFKPGLGAQAVSSLAQVEATVGRPLPHPRGCGGPKALVPKPLRGGGLSLGESLSREPGCAVIPKGELRHRAGSE